MLENSLRFRQLAYENKFLKNMIDPDLKLAGVQCLSPSMKAVYDLIKRVAPTESSVLITAQGRLHVAVKMLPYLLAIRCGASAIFDTIDDDIGLFTEPLATVNPWMIEVRDL